MRFYLQATKVRLLKNLANQAIQNSEEFAKDEKEFDAVEAKAFGKGVLYALELLEQGS